MWVNDVVNCYKLLKKDVCIIVVQQVVRLEFVMCLCCCWLLENFQFFLVEYLLVCYLICCLIWGVYSVENQLLVCFCVVEDNSFSIVDDDFFILLEGDIFIGIFYVLEILLMDVVVFGQFFVDYELLLLFRQFDCNSYVLIEVECNVSELICWVGRKCLSGWVMGLVNKGWIKGELQDGGWIGWMIKFLGCWLLIMEIDEGFVVGMLLVEFSVEQFLSKLWLWEGKVERYGWGSNLIQEVQFFVIDVIIVSELINDIEVLFE